jgi:hypothetical protein
MPSPDRPRSLSAFAEKHLGLKPPKPARFKDVKQQLKKRKTA